MSSFASIRNQIKSLETNIDKSLTKLSNYEKSFNEDEAFETSIKSEIQTNLEETHKLIEKLSTINEFENLSTSKIQQLTRHKEIYYDHNKYFVRLCNSIQDIKNKNNLLFSIRSDLNNRSQSQAQNPDLNANDYILEEGERVNDLNSFSERLLQSAYSTRDELINQRNILFNSNFNISNSIQQIPGLNVLINRIDNRRKRDTLILATVISLCILFLFFF